MKSIFNKLKQWWMAFAHAWGWVSTRVLLSLAYAIFFGVGAIVLLLIRKDLLHRKFTKQQSYWIDKEPVQHTLEQSKQQF